MQGMKRAILMLACAAAVCAAGDSWDKVQQLKGGAALRIYKVNAQAPLTATLDRAGEQSLIVFTRNGQLSIPKEEIDRLDWRPAQRVDRTARVNRKVAPKGAEVTSNTMPGATTTVGVKLGKKAPFETIYRREDAAK